MAKTSNVSVHVEPEIKKQAEQILNRLGIPLSTAVSAFLRQVVLQRGIPLEMKLPPDIPRRPVDLWPRDCPARAHKRSQVVSIAWHSPPRPRKGRGAGGA